MSQGCQQTRPSEREEFNAKTPHHSIPMTRHRCALNPEKPSKQKKKKKKKNKKKKKKKKKIRWGYLNIIIGDVGWGER
jgi:hypothetical protein